MNSSVRADGLPETKPWRSCCCLCERSFVVFLTQTIFGLCILTFCAYQLSSDIDCNRATPYWGLIGTICGFFFRKISFQSKYGRRSGVNSGVGSESRASP